MRTLNLQKLVHAVVVSEQCSLVAASKKLHITQSALTRSIQSLEAELGVKIFNRIPSGVELTGEGKMVLERARDILDQTQSLYRDTLTLSSGSRSIVSFGIDPILTEIIAPKLLEQVVGEAQLMQVQLKIESRNTLLSLLQEEVIDFFVSDINDFTPIDKKEIVIEELMTARGSLYVRKGHPLAALGAVDAEALFAYPVVSPSNVHEKKWDPFDWQNLHPGKNDRKQQVICPDALSLRHVIYHTDAIWATLDAIVVDDLGRGKLVRLDYQAKDQNDMRHIGLVMLQESTPSLHTKRLIQQVKALLNASLGDPMTLRPSSGAH